MAKRTKSRKAKPTTRRRRRRVSGIGSGIDMQGIALAGLGAVGVSLIKKQLTKDPTKTTMVNLAPYVGIAGAVLLPMLIKNAMVKQVAIGMGAMGIYNALQKLAPNVVGQLDYMTPIISATSNKYRRLPQPSVNGIGYSLPLTSVYKDSMSVVNGIGCYATMNPVNPGSGAAI